MDDSNRKAFWQRTARLYAPFMKSAAPLYDEIARRCRPYLAPDLSVLELACGSGQLTFRLAGSVRRWEATDFSEKMVAESKKRAGPPGLRFAVRDATALPYAAGSFGAVLVANALHIMPEPGKALAEIFRVLKPGGILLAPTFVWSGNDEHRFRTALMNLAGFRVLHRWDARAFEEFVAQRGFTVLARDVLRGGVSPLCCLAARKSEIIGRKMQNDA